MSKEISNEDTAVSGTHRDVDGVDSGRKEPKNMRYVHHTGEEEKNVEDMLTRFRELMENWKPQSPKFDMIALRLWRDKGHKEKPVIGCHPPGVRLGQKFQYRAELVVCRIHTKCMSGIDYWQNSPCNAIVMAGRYADDSDTGQTFTYSGEGGVRDGSQVANQTWTRGNSALLLSFKKRIPVKVIRCINFDIKKGGPKAYVYDGLYLVENAWTAMKGAYKVCMFSLMAVNNQSTVSGTVKTGELYLGHKRMTVSQPRRRRVEIGQRFYGHTSPAADLVVLEIERGVFLEKRGNVLCMDISYGKEPIRIPLINDTGEEVEIPNFHYVTSLDHTTPAADELILEAGMHERRSGCRKLDHVNYDEYGSLKSTLPEGIWECPLTCTFCQNSVAATGIRYPLEVFKTAEKGWGVRSSVDIPSGAFVCEYTGEVLTDEEAEQGVAMRDSTYLYSLDHFYLLKRSALLGRQDILEDNMPQLPLSDEDIRNEKFDGRFLVIDAKNKGMSQPTTLERRKKAQMVILEGCNGVIHHVGFFAMRNIPKYTELVHDYGWNKGIGKDLICQCNDVRCKGVVLS